ncbi:HPP family protein [Magnetovibrio sp.]|uniref:HPP family protein n=1 Tax=Magnetovibrio sp. TaxID=2024836 RepID=UPI002F9489FB
MQNQERKPDHQPAHHVPMARPPLSAIAWSVVSSGLAIFVLAELESLIVIGHDAPLIIGAFGASAVLLFGAPNSPLAQPYNVLVGHVLSAAIGVAAYKAVGVSNGVSMALAVSLAIGGMQLTRSLHPPGGASALIAVIGTDRIHDLGFQYVASPVALGVAVLLLVAFATNNVFGKKSWPLFWFPVSRVSRRFWRRQTQE